VEAEENNMAHSIQEYEGRHEIMHDIPILIIGTIIINSVERQKITSLLPMIKSWKDSFDLYGPGTIDLRLNNFLINEETWRDFCEQVEQARQAINAHDMFDIYKMDECAYRPSRNIIAFCEVPSRTLSSAIDQIKKLIAI
jgi:hypothetical protein